MTNEHSHPTPSSIRDDSICEPSLPPNKSSGDIVERLLDRSDHYLPDWADAAMKEAAAEIERLRREVEEANRFWNERCVQTSVNAHGWMQAHDQLLGFIQSRPDLLKVMMAEKFEIKYPAPADTPTLLQRALTAESAVAAAYENAAKIAERDTRSELAKKYGFEPIWFIHGKAIASAIRAAVGKGD